MNTILRTLYSAIKTKVVSLWTKIKLWTSPAFIKSRILLKIREFFTRLLDIRPRDKKDYYTFFGWMVSKRLAFAVVVLLGALSLWYLSVMKPSLFTSDLLSSSNSVRTYKYNAIPLKFYSGQARILAKADYVAYVGNVKEGVVTGSGKLYSKDGVMLYDGMFGNNMFNGTGKQYYDSGVLQYEGEFTDNYYSGAGVYYNISGAKEYLGEFVMGLRHGAGELYNAGGDKIYTGTFSFDNMLYSEMVGQTTQDVSSIYSGEYQIYSSDTDYCVLMPEIDAAYYGISGEDSLDTSMTVGGVYVLKDSFSIEGNNFTGISELTKYFGEPIYKGNTAITVTEAVAMNALADAGYEGFDRISMDTTKEFDNVFQINSYDDQQATYLYTYAKDGFLYTFYSMDKDSGFGMYLIVKE